MAYRRNYFNVQTSVRGESFGLPDAIKRLTQPNDVIVIQSPDWNSMLPYYTERRTLIIPDSQMFLREDAVCKSIRLLQDENVPLVVFRGETQKHSEWMVERIRDFDLALFPLFTWQDDAVVYARRSDYRRMHLLLEGLQFPGVMLSPIDPLPALKKPTRIAGTLAWEGIPNMDPRPHSGSFPYGIKYRYIDGKKALFGDPPTELYFDIPVNATRVELGYQMAPDAYEHRDFDGAYVILELLEEGRAPVSLFEEVLTPSGPRGMHKAVVSLPRSVKGTLVLRTLGGPTNNSAYDWIVFNFLRIH